MAANAACLWDTYTVSLRALILYCGVNLQNQWPSQYCIFQFLIGISNLMHVIKSPKYVFFIISLSVDGITSISVLFLINLVKTQSFPKYAYLYLNSYLKS